MTDRTIGTIEDLKKHYYAKTKGHWFDDGNMRFFNSRLDDSLLFFENKIIFFSSEKGPMNDAPRRYSIREYDTETGNIETIGLGFGGYTTLAAAKLAAWKIMGVDQP